MRDAVWIKPSWPAPANVCAVVSTRLGPGVSTPPYDQFNLGNYCGDDPIAVTRNRDALIHTLRLPNAPVWLRQVHGTKVHEIDEALSASEPEADAAIARLPGQVSVVLTADCLPLLVCAKDGTEVAAIHAGWRGLNAGVIEACINQMHTPATELLVWLGPAIGPTVYEVGTEVHAAFVEHNPKAKVAFTTTRLGRWLCDLYTLTRQRLSALGIQNIYGGNFCTFSDSKRFFSHRRDGQSGRMASLIWIRAQ